jgi:hypothetical protein
MQALEEARQEVRSRAASGFNQAALDEVARAGFAAGAFEESAEDGAAVVEEFYPQEPSDPPRDASKRSLANKMQDKADQVQR